MTKNHTKKHRHVHAAGHPMPKKRQRRLQHQIDEAVRRVLDEYGDVIHKLGKE